MVSDSGSVERVADQSDKNAQAAMTWRGIPLLTVTLALALAIVVLDQATKAIAIASLSGKDPIEVIGTLVQFRLIRNPGAAFSIGTGMTWIFSLVAICVIVFIVKTARKLGSLPWAIALGGLLGGSLGNLVDRLFREPGPLRGHVVDFVQMPIFGVFNIADMAITFSAIAIVILTLFGFHLDGTRGDPQEYGVNQTGVGNE